MSDYKGQITSPTAAVKYLFAGKAFVTFRSLISGCRFTYKIELAEKRHQNDPDIYFVNVLVGPDNWTNYKYIGIIKDGKYCWTSKAKIGQDAPSVKGFQFCFTQVAQGVIKGFEVWHEGKCGRCGRKLTVPESVADGFGPDCVNLVDQTTRTIVAGSSAPQDGLYQTLQNSLDVTPRAAVNGTPAPHVGDIDAEIRHRIAKYKSEAPENYFHDGELDEKQAFSVAYNKFRVQIERERGN